MDEEEGNWDMNCLSSKIPSAALSCVLKVILPQFVIFPDTPHWKGSIGGGFSTVAAYKIASNQVVDNMDLDLEWVWKLKVPQNLKSFLWLIFFVGF